VEEGDKTFHVEFLILDVALKKNINFALFGTSPYNGTTKEIPAEGASQCDMGRVLFSYFFYKEEKYQRVTYYGNVNIPIMVLICFIST
jgi:hypothetical protein